MRECYSCDDVLLVPRHSELSSRQQCDISAFDCSIPIISSPMDRVWSPSMDEYLTSNNIYSVVHRYFKDAKHQLDACTGIKGNEKFRFFAVGSIHGQHKTTWIDHLLENGIENFCVDMAHGDSYACVETVKYISQRTRGMIMAGNIATKSGFRRLEEAGAQMIRVGIGSGSICSTRLNAGFGVPLLSAVEDCYSVRDNALIIADGGIKYPGDIAKAIAFGADFCMLGKMLASTSLAPGECKQIDGVYYKEYRGMASRQAREGVMKKASVEGVSGWIPYTGNTKDVIEDVSENLKASLSYAGSTNWYIFRKSVKKIRITNSAWNESMTHIKGD